MREELQLGREGGFGSAQHICSPDTPSEGGAGVDPNCSSQALLPSLPGGGSGPASLCDSQPRLSGPVQGLLRVKLWLGVCQVAGSGGGWEPWRGRGH